ncbi:MAG: hypothetical protein WBV06_06485 [Acidimicrobiia bacterium]
MKELAWYVARSSGIVGHRRRGLAPVGQGPDAICGLTAAQGETLPEV